LLDEGDVAELDRVALDSHAAGEAQCLQRVQLVDASLGLDIFGRELIGGHRKSSVRTQAHDER